jgi:hypothetical protein
MFLDDQIVNMVIERYPNTQKESMELLNDILKLCMEKVSKNLRSNMSDSNILPSTKQVCNLWDSACKTLDKKGYHYLQMGGFRTYILNDPELAKILIPLGL